MERRKTVDRSSVSRRNRRRRWAAAVVVLGTVAGCGSGGTDEPDAAGSATSDAAQSGSATDDAGSDDAAPGGGGTLRVAIAEPVGILDPQDFTGQFLALDMVYEPLVAYGDEGELEPGLAESWDVADDGSTITFDLRDDVVFHDGTSFDAEAVKWNMDRWVQNERFSFFRASQIIDEVVVVDADTVELALSRAYAPLLQELSIGRPVRFLSPSSADESGAFVEPVGTGPWKYVSSSDTTGVFERNDDYWGEQPTLEGVEFQVIPDSQTRLSALRADEVDLIGGAYLAPINSIEATEIDNDDELTLFNGQADTTLVLGFDTDGPLGDEDVRRAVAMATDVASLNEVLYGGASEVANGLYSPAVPFSSDTFDHEFDPDAASAVLDEAGWVLDGDVRTKDGTPLQLELLLVSGPVHGQQDSANTGQAIADGLGRIGIQVDLRSVDGAAHFEEVSAGNYDMAFFVTYGAPYDPSSSTVAFLTGGGDEAPLWADPELDDLVDRALFASTDDEIQAAYEQIYSFLDDTSAFVPITHPPRFYAVGPHVSGFDVPPTDYDMELNGVTVTR